MSNTILNRRDATVLLRVLLMTIVGLPSACTQALIKPGRSTPNGPINFRFIRARILAGYAAPPSPWGVEIELVPNSHIAHKRMLDSEAEESATLSDSDIARINGALTRANIFALPARVGKTYADVPEMTLYVESGDGAKTLQVCAGQDMNAPQTAPVMELWTLIESIFPNHQ